MDKNKSTIDDNDENKPIVIVGFSSGDKVISELYRLNEEEKEMVLYKPCLILTDPYGNEFIIKWFALSDQEFFPITTDTVITTVLAEDSMADKYRKKSEKLYGEETKLVVKGKDKKKEETNIYYKELLENFSPTKETHYVN